MIKTLITFFTLATAVKISQPNRPTAVKNLTENITESGCAYGETWNGAEWICSEIDGDFNMTNWTIDGNSTESITESA